MRFWYQVSEALCSVLHALGSNLDMALPNPEHPWLCHEDLPTRASGAGMVGQLNFLSCRAWHVQAWGQDVIQAGERNHTLQ